MIEQTVEAVTKYAIGLIGALISLKFIDTKLKPMDKVIMGTTGALAAGFLTPAFISLLNLDYQAYENALAFVVGLYAWSIMGGLMKAIRSVNWLKVFYETIRILRK